MCGFWRRHAVSWDRGVPTLSTDDRRTHETSSRRSQHALGFLTAAAHRRGWWWRMRQDTPALAADHVIACIKTAVAAKQAWSKKSKSSMRERMLCEVKLVERRGTP